MSNFNEYFRKQGAKIMVDRFLGNVDVYNTKKKITSLKHHIVEEPPHPASYYIENGLTATHKVKIEYTINDEPEILYSEFEVPKEIDGAFIIEGSYRIATNKLGKDYDCRINMSGSGDYMINFDFDRKYDINKRILKVKRNNPELRITERALEIKYDDIDGLTGEKKELLKLTEKQSKKFQIKLDLDYKPEYITTKLIQECLAFGDDRLRDLIIDKQIESVPTGFMQFLFRSANGRNYFSVRRLITDHFTKQGYLAEQLNPITRLSFRFFKGTSEAKAGEANLQVPPGVNAINLESLGSKITIPETTAFNSSYTDLIDFADTPINNNTNLQNSLTVSAHVTDDTVLFDVYNKDFKKITIEYLDYLNSKVCASEYVDYHTNTLKPDQNGEVEIKYRMKRKMVPVDEVELIDLHPDYRLSETTRRIPFVNSTDSVRISMGTGMLKQSIPLVNAQRALVDTGNNEELENNILNEKFEYDKGKVVKIDEDKISIELPNGEITDVLRRTAIQSQNDVCVYTEPKVKVGQKVQKGDVICGAVGLNKDTYKAGLNTLVLFSAHFGLVNEDALVVSESYAERMSHYSLIDLMINIKTSSSLKWIAPIGTRVKSGDSVVALFKTQRLDDVNRTLNEKLGGLFGEEGKDLTEYMTVEYLKVPNNIDEAYVSDVMVQEMKNPVFTKKSDKKPDYTFSRQSNKVIEEYEKNKNRKVIYDKFPEYVAADTLDPIIMDPENFKVVYTIRVRLIKKTGLMVGSKVTNRYGGKGVVSTVTPDELMPIMVDETGKKRRVEVIMNPYSTINRKIAGVLLEQELGNIAHKIYDLVEQYKTTKTGQKKIMPLVTKYYPGRYDKMSVEDFIKLHNSKPIEEVYYFNVGCFSDYTPERVDKMMDELGVESQSTILMPETELADLGELKENLSEEEYEKVVKNMTGKFIPVDKKLQCGYMTLEELYHLPAYSNKVTSSMTDINPKRGEPILGRGRYRLTGQKIGEMELSVLLSRNSKQYIAAARRDTAREDNQVFLNNLLGLGLTIVDEHGYNQGGSSLKSDLNKMKAKFRLKNQK